MLSSFLPDKYITNAINQTRKTVVVISSIRGFLVESASHSRLENIRNKA